MKRALRSVMSWRPRLRTVLIAVNVVVLTMPLAALGIFRIYDTELIRRTESELVAQTTYASVLYGRALAEMTGDGIHAFGKPGTERWPVDPDSGLRPIPTELRLSLDDIREPAGDARPTEKNATGVEIAAGIEVSEVLRAAQPVTLAGIRVVNSAGVVVGSTRREFGMSLAHREEVKRALDGEFVSIARERLSDSPVPQLDSISRRTRLRVFVAMPVVVEGRIVGAVVASRTPISLQKAAYDNRWIFTLLFIGLLAGVLVISVLTSLTIARPIRALRNKAAALADPDEPLEPLEEPGTAEIRELSAAFLHTTAALRERERYLQTFARDVRHEFKAPLSSLRGAVELLQEHSAEMSEERRAKFLANLGEDVDRIEALTHDLLELARADVAQATGAASLVEDAVARATVDGVELAVDLPDDLRVTLPLDDLESVFRNIFGNVALHGGSRASVKGALRGDYAVVEVEDAGPGFDDEVLERATEPFVTTARGRGGTGLGLSIVAGYLDAHGGELELFNRDGAVVRLVMPLAEA